MAFFVLSFWFDTRDAEGDVDDWAGVVLDESSSLHVLQNMNKNKERNCSEPILPHGPATWSSFPVLVNDDESQEEKLKQNISSKKLNHELHN